METNIIINIVRGMLIDIIAQKTDTIVIIELIKLGKL